MHQSSAARSKTSRDYRARSPDPECSVTVEKGKAIVDNDQGERVGNFTIPSKHGPWISAYYAILESGSLGQLHTYFVSFKAETFEIEKLFDVECPE